MCGPVSGSLQFRAVARQCSPPFAYESGSEKRTEVPERVRSGHDTGTNNRSQLCKSRCSCLEKRRRKEERDEKKGRIREEGDNELVRFMVDGSRGQRNEERKREVRKIVEGYVIKSGIEYGSGYRLSTPFSF